MPDYDRILPLQTTKSCVKNQPPANQSCLQMRKVMIERVVIALLHLVLNCPIVFSEWICDRRQLFLRGDDNYN